MCLTFAKHNRDINLAPCCLRGKIETNNLLKSKVLYLHNYRYLEDRHMCCYFNPNYKASTPAFITSVANTGISIHKKHNFCCCSLRLCWVLYFIWWLQWWCQDITFFQLHQFCYVLDVFLFFFQLSNIKGTNIQDHSFFKYWELTRETHRKYWNICQYMKVKIKNEQKHLMNKLCCLCFTFLGKTS